MDCYFADNLLLYEPDRRWLAKYVSVAEMVKKWGISERSVGNYSAERRVEGAFITGKTWNIPENAVRPARINQKSDKPKNLLEFLRAEKAGGIKGGIYHKVQIELTYNSNHIEGSRLTHDQTRYIYETNTIGMEAETVNVDDILETANHFRCIDLCIEQANQPLSEAFTPHLEKRHQRFPQGLVCGGRL
ncbi:MAG: hypothetical protein HUJ54_01510 [Erysipelotrichaceae bacterium]|nr:hypothetical protein [Erysipelotrichaceae bacterium]